MSETLGQSGPKPTITHNGKTWEIAYPTRKAKDHFTAIITASAVAECKALKGVLSDEDFAALWRDLTTKIQAGHFRTLNAGWLEVMMGVDADAFFLLSLLRVSHPEATIEHARELYSECPEEIAAAYAVVVPDFLSSLEKDWPPKIPKARRSDLSEQLRVRLQPAPSI